jgi:hypothetical protein
VGEWYVPTWSGEWFLVMVVDMFCIRSTPEQSLGATTVAK